MTISIQQQRHGHRRPLACSVGAVLTTALLATTLGLPLAVPAQAQAQSSPNASAEVSGETAAKDAVTQARRSGKPVGVDAFTTPTTTLTANPSGTFTLDQSLHPVRIRRHGKWVPVDASLHRTPDGALTPAAVPSPVTLSGGGSKTLATLGSHGKSLAVSWPNPLPAPIVAGDTATYPEVLPGVDLKATASSLGGFSEVLVIKNATAASNPKLDRLVLGTSGPSLTVSADSAGNLRATDTSGAVQFASPAPLMWDSSALQTVTDGKAPLIGDATPPTMADTSSPASPGRGAHIAPIPTRATANTVTLNPDQKMLRGPNTHYPVYIDPAWNPVSANDPKQTHDEIQEGCPDKNALNSGTAPYDTPGVGMNSYSGCIGREEAYFQFRLDSRLLNSQVRIVDATFKAMEIYSASCSITSNVIVKQSLSQINSSTTWNNRPSLGNTQGQPQPYGSACTSTVYRGFDVLDAVTRSASQRKNWVAFGLIAEDDSNGYYFRRFSNNPTLSVHYDTVPAVSSLSTSPDAALIGHTAVTLNAYISDDDQGAPVQGKFTLLGKAADGTTVYPLKSFAPANTVTEQGNISWFVGYLPTGTYLWTAQADDGRYQSVVRSRTFKVDATAPGAPQISSTTLDNAAGNPLPARSPVEFTLKPPQGSTDVVKYAYNWGISPPSVNPRSTIRAAGGATATTFTVVPSGFLRASLQVYAIDAAGNQSPVNHYDFDMQEPQIPDATGDFSGDGLADLLTPGPDGNLRLYPAANNGALSTPVNVTAVDDQQFVGARVAVGAFRGHKEQDVLAITMDGQAHIYAGDGGAVPMASTIKLSDGTVKVPPQNAILDDSPYMWSQVTQIAADDSRQAQGLFPDLWAITSDGALWWIPSTRAYGVYDFSLSQQLATGWQKKTLTSAGIVQGAPALWVRDTDTGVLDLFTGTVVNPDDRTQDTHAGAAASTLVSSTTGWKASSRPSLLPACLGTGGTSPASPTLWATDSNAVHNINYYAAGSTAGTLSTAPVHVQMFTPSDDFTGDGKADIAASRGDGTLRLYTGQGGGQLTSGQQIWDSTWGSVAAMTSGDFTGDGKSDIVAIRGDNSLHLYPGTGTGGLDAQHVTQLFGGTTWSTAREITAGDFNGDGLADLVAIWNDGTLHLYPNNGNNDINQSTLLWPDNSWSGYKLLSAGDYNGDGNSDILAVRLTDGNLRLYLGDGHGHISGGQLATAGLDWSTIKDIIPGDFSGDGKTDLAAIWGDGTLHLYTGNGSGNFTNTGTMWNDNTWATTKLAT